MHFPFCGVYKKISALGLVQLECHVNFEINPWNSFYLKPQTNENTLFVFQDIASSHW